jgi:hypothetical protein
VRTKRSVWGSGSSPRGATAGQRAAAANWGPSLLLLAAAGCVTATPPTQLHPKTTAAHVAAAATAKTYEITDKDVDDIVQEVSVARQLAPTKTVAVQRLDAAAFAERVAGEVEAPESAPEGLSQESAFLVGFDFLPAPSQRGGLASERDVLKEQVAGFYDSKLDRIFVPSLKLKSKEDVLEQRAVLAHEVQHALQSQRLHAFNRTVHENSDEALARLALIEGDAMVAMGSALGAEAGAPVGRTLRRIVEETKRIPLSTVTRGERGRKLDQALDLTRERMLFPYREGMLFVSDIYRAGGFPLVDQIYESPPTSTAQILHPEKYLRNEQPRKIADPKAPAGYRRAAVDTLGELDTKVLLSRCLDPKVAETAATGWAGSRFAVFVGPQRNLAVAWISVLDSEADARELEQALQGSEACWHDNALGLSTGDYVIGSRFHVERHGDKVGFIRGLDGVSEGATMRGLFSLVGARSKTAPVSTAPIPPRVPLPEPVHGTLQGDVYVNEWLGLTGRVAPGMLGTAGGKDLDFMVERPGVLIRGGLAYSLRIASEEQNERTFHEVEESFAKAAGRFDQQIEVIRGGKIDTALGGGVERTWRMAGTTVEERVVLVPICAATGSVAFIQVYGDPYARSVLDAWINSFRWLHGRNLVACDYLDPK